MGVRGVGGEKAIAQHAANVAQNLHHPAIAALSILKSTAAWTQENMPPLDGNYKADDK